MFYFLLYDLYTFDFFFLLSYYTWLRPPVQYQIEMVVVDIYVLLITSEENFQ